MSSQVLVTGASGFIGAHCALDLLAHGYTVRGTVRSRARADHVRAMLQSHGADTQRLSFAEATLTDPSCWPEAVADCDAIFHVASPVPTVQPKDPGEVIGPARAGTMNVLKAAAEAGITRVVLTSSVASILGGVSESRLYTAADWSDPSDPHLTPYSLSKTLAEKDAWQFCEEHGIRLTTIHPSLVLGPALEADYGSSLEALVKLLQFEVPLLPRFGFEVVDVRDVASLHRLALEQETSVGQRLIASNGFLWFREIAAVLKQQYPARRIPQREMPNWLTKLASLLVPEIASFIADLDVVKNLDNRPARDMGWEPRSPEEAIRAGAESLVRFGVV